MRSIVPEYASSHRSTVISYLPDQATRSMKSNCILCHDFMAEVEQASQTWVQEPVCGNEVCHGVGYQYFQLEISSQNPLLFSNVVITGWLLNQSCGGSKIYTLQLPHLGKVS